MSHKHTYFFFFWTGAVPRSPLFLDLSGNHFGEVLPPAAPLSVYSPSGLRTRCLYTGPCTHQLLLCSRLRPRGHQARTCSPPQPWPPTPHQGSGQHLCQSSKRHGHFLVPGHWETSESRTGQSNRMALVMDSHLALSTLSQTELLRSSSSATPLAVSRGGKIWGGGLGQKSPRGLH